MNVLVHNSTMSRKTRIVYDELPTADLQVDTIYESQRGTGVNLGIEPLTKLIRIVQILVNA